MKNNVKNIFYLLVLLAFCLIFCIALAGCTPGEIGKIGVDDGKNVNIGDNDNDPDPTGDLVEITVLFNGNTLKEYYPEGSVVCFAGVYYGKEVSLDPNFSELLGEYDGVTVTKGLTVHVRDKQQLPTEVKITFYDVDRNGDLTVFEQETTNYGRTLTFDGSGFILYSDPECKNEIDPNLEMTLTEDISVYRKDNMDRYPVFLRVHYYINGIEYTGIGQTEVCFRGELLRDSTYIIYDTDYTFYRDLGKSQKMFENGRVEVVRESDDKADIYAFKNDPSVHAVTFTIGEKVLGTTLMNHNDTISEFSASCFPGNSYIIRNCSAMGKPVTSDMTVNITEYDVIRTFPVTEHCCYNGDVKYSFTNYNPVDDPYPMEIEVTDDIYSNYYNDVKCTQVFSGKVTSAAVFYRVIYVNFDRYVGNR